MYNKSGLATSPNSESQFSVVQRCYRMHHDNYISDNKQSEIMPISEFFYDTGDNSILYVFIIV